MVQAREESENVVYQIPANYLEMIARLDERTKIIIDSIPNLATKESVDQVKTNLSDHIDNHKDTRTLWPVWLGLAASTALGIIGCFRGVKP